VQSRPGFLIDRTARGGADRRRAATVRPANDVGHVDRGPPLAVGHVVEIVATLAASEGTGGIMTMLSEGVTPPHYQRRIGHRYPVRVQITWSPMHARHWPHKATACTTTTDNMSLTGIGFESPTCPDVSRGSPVEITIGQTVCGALVRFSRPGRTPGVSYYGLEVRDRAMIDTMQELITEHRRRHPGRTRVVEPPPQIHPSLRPVPDS
jgi:hypothetical protein